jgi:hypothetical protein
MGCCWGGGGVGRDQGQQQQQQQGWLLGGGGGVTINLFLASIKKKQDSVRDLNQVTFDLKINCNSENSSL